MAGDQRDKVLVVEDDMLLSMVAERLIDNLGYCVIGKATSGKEAIRQVTELNPDIIIMDISLKGDMNGIDAMKEIRKTSQIPVIYLSGSADDDFKEKARETNYAGFLTKPVTKSDLKEILLDALNSDKKKSSKTSAWSNTD